MAKKSEQFRSSEKLCWECETKVNAKRPKKNRGLGDLMMLAITVGLWLPIRLMYEGVAAPWRCERCENRIDPWYRDMGRGAGYGFGGLAIVWVALPGLIAVYSDTPTTSDGAAERSAQAIERTKSERKRLTIDFDANRDRIVDEVRTSISKKQYMEASKRAEPFMFIADSELVKLHSFATRKAKEANLLRTAKSLPSSNLSGNADVYAKLAALVPSNAIYQQKHKHYAGKLAAQQKLAAERAASAQRKAARARAAKEKLAATRKAESDALVAKFGDRPAQSPWDGGYFVVKNYLKRVANDPDSIDLDGCTKVYKTGQGWLVGCDYRGRNGFGGMIRKSNWFTIRNLQVVKMHDPDAYKL